MTSLNRHFVSPGFVEPCLQGGTRTGRGGNQEEITLLSVSMASFSLEGLADSQEGKWVGNWEETLSFNLSMGSKPS